MPDNHDEIRRIAHWQSIYSNQSAGELMPPTVSGNKTIWLDGQASSTILNASDLPASDGEGVKTWQDRSGNGFHVSQTNASLRPTYRSSLSVFSLPGIEFDGLNDYLIRTTDQIHGSTYTGFMVWSPMDNGVKGQYVFTPGAAVLQQAYMPLGTYSAGVGQDLAFTGPTCSMTYSFGTKYYTTIAFNQASSYQYQNGVQSTVGNVGTTSSVGMALGAVYTGTNATKMELCEMIWYDAALSGSDIDAVEAYLVAKWGI